MPNRGEDGADAGDVSGDDEPSVCCSLKSVLGTGIPP